MNIYDDHPFKVILDYAHNLAAVKAMGDLVDRFDVEGRKTVVLAAPSDRRNEDIHEIARMAAGHFDHSICRWDDNRRGRGASEVADMLKETLLAEGVDEAALEVVPDKQAATQHALDTAKPGDLLLVLGDNVKRTWTRLSKDTTISLPPTRSCC